MKSNFYQGEKYLSFLELETYCKQLASDFPQWVSFKNVGNSRAGRSIFMLVIGRQDAQVEKRPAIWIDGGTHAIEWVGVMSTLYTASRFVEGLSGGDEVMQEWFSRNTAIVLPCISPDGFNATMNGSAYIRSTLRPTKDGEVRVGLDMSDVNGDGSVRYLRIKHPSGTMVPDGVSAILMRPRTLDDDEKNAYYVMREGELINWDGFTWSNAPNPFAIDLNRNFPARWTPFSMIDQDSGDYPISEPESRTTVDAFASFPYIGAAVTNHSYSGCILTQPYCSNTPLHDGDIRLLKTLARELVSGTGYATYEVLKEFAYDPKKDIVGVWADTITTVFGVPGYTLELWDPYGYAGLDVKKPAEQFFHPDPELLRALFMHFELNHPELCHAWKSFEHPQLGEVEIGGIDYMRSIHNPPESMLADECRKGHLIADRLRRALPQVTAATSVVKVGDYRQVSIVLENSGYLPTSGTDLGKKLRPTPPVSAEIILGPGMELLAEPSARGLDHLEGWGSLATGLAAHPLYPVLPKNGQRQRVQWLVKGIGTVTIKWYAGRAGEGVETVTL